MYTDGGVLSGWSCETDGRAYGLNDPSLDGFNPFKVITAPFRATFKVAKVAVKTAIKIGPRTVAGFVAGGPVGAFVGGASTFFGGGDGGYTATPVQTVGSYPRSNPANNPYGLAAQPYWAGGTGQYQKPYQPPRRSPGDQLVSMFNLLKDELLATGARKIAETPAGRAAIQEKVTGDIGRYLLPISIGAGVLVLTLALTRGGR